MSYFVFRCKGSTFFSITQIFIRILVQICTKLWFLSVVIRILVQICTKLRLGISSLRGEKANKGQGTKSTKDINIDKAS